MAPRRPALFCVVAFLILQLALVRDAFAWVELHVARDDVRLSVSPDGSARVEHKILLLVSGGPLKSFTVRGVDADALLEDGAFIAPEKALTGASKEEAQTKGDFAAAVPLAVKRISDPSTRTDLEVTIDGGAGVSRGRYVAVLRYRTNLLAAGNLRTEGATSTIDWIGPSWEDGIETSRVTFVLPRGKSEPRASEGEDSDRGAGTYLASLTRKNDEDVLELLRPYVSKGERVLWSIQADARLFDPQVAAPSAPGSESARRSIGIGDPKQVTPSTTSSMLLFGALALFLLVAALIAAHGLEIERRARERVQALRPLSRLPIAVRAPLASLVFVGGIWLELSRPRSLVGVLMVASTVLFVWYRNAEQKPTPRAPGSWLFVRTEEAFRVARPAAAMVFDLAGWTGRAVLFVLVVVFALVGRWVAQTSTLSGIVVALDVVPLLALWRSGPRSLVPDLAVDSIPLLTAVSDRVRKKSRGRARIAPRVRMPLGEPDPDEIRVAFLPERGVFGLRAIEVGVAFGAGPGGYVLLPEVLVRFDEGTPCEALLSDVGRYGRVVRGRKADERVIAIVPKLPTARVTADLVLALLETTSQPAATAKPTPTPGDRGKGAARRPPVSRRAREGELSAPSDEAQVG